ncbi:MAG: polysaccharide biosynthesis protein [Eubacteriales bacterium]|nr:polysaccharide biosynthesis protein [Eubacteriales bacterium]MDD3072806.1 polysaccharide biosynthesis protein [Eubacteriales bacterium]MDD4078350.1 polysaccharide biosynthesis protein [Eubacteriales bacterium]MDD4768844.1 polysaccharide biosynthesis protein [Eubacteriales bacterium]
MQEDNKFIKGALILSIANIIVKILGAVYRFPLFRILGDEGMGLFMAVYPIYSMMLSISTAGVPLAVSKLVSEKIALKNFEGARQIFRVALMLMLASGLIFTGVLMLAAPYYSSNILKVSRTLYPLMAIAPSIVFYAVKASFRGYFQGQQRMEPSAVASIVEQLVRVGTIFLLAIVLVKHSLELGAAGAAFGSVTGAAAGLLWLIFIYFRSAPEYNRLSALSDQNSLVPTKKVIKDIFALALPITIGSIVVPVVNMVDATLILPRLQAGGFSEDAALALQGIFSGAAMSLVNVPTIFTLALGTSLLPAIAKAYAQKQNNLIKRLSSLSIRVGQIIGLPSAIGLFVLAEPISIFLYDNLAVARPLSVVAFATIFIILNQTTSPVLQGIGKTYLPVTHMFFGLLAKVIINYFLTPIPAINILGPAIGTIVAFALASFLNLRSIKKLVGGGISITESFIKPSLNAVLMGMSVYFLYPLFNKLASALLGAQLSETYIVAAAVIVSIGVGIVVYGIATLLTGTISRSELELIPKIGPKLANIFTRLGLLR